MSPWRTRRNRGRDGDARPDAPLSFVIAGSTDVGKVRERNEDDFILICLGKRLSDDSEIEVRCNPGPAVVAVADGMGGMGGGDVASKIAVDTLRTHLVEHPTAGPDQLQPLIAGAFRRANERILERGFEDPSLARMGTTLSVVAFLDQRFFVAHVGDSRVYHLREGELRQLSVDDSYVEGLVARGEISEAEAVHHPARGQITRAVGVEDGLKIQEFEGRSRIGDSFLLCSDGLHGFVSEKHLIEEMTSSHRPAKQVARLLALANDAGGEDNVTVVIAHVITAEIG